MMSEDIVVEGWRGAKPQPKAGRFDRISIAVHWLTVLLVATQFATAWLLNLSGSDASRILLVHRSIGILTWVVVVLRLIWRHAFAYLPPFPVSMPKLQQRIAKLNEYGLYGLLLVQPLTGLGNTLLHGRPLRYSSGRCRYGSHPTRQSRSCSNRSTSLLPGCFWR